ncbi:MAG: hypothetical protein ACE5K3_04700 [bacterium]
MVWPLSIYRVICPKKRFVRAQILVLYETQKALLADNGMKIWIPQLQIYGVRLGNSISEIYVEERSVR